MIASNSDPIKEYLAKADKEDDEDSKAHALFWSKEQRIPYPKGIFLKRCPFCNTRVRKERLTKNYSHYKCSNCNYDKMMFTPPLNAMSSPCD